MTAYIVMGVSGAGKSTIGIQLANALQHPFIEGDDFHPESNLAKMSSGQPLTNEDRRGWIKALAAEINSKPGASVSSCSALNATVQAWLIELVAQDICFICLEGSRELLLGRLNARAGHFFKASMLDSQLEAFSPPKDAIFVSIDKSPKEICEDLLETLKSENR